MGGLLSHLFHEAPPSAFCPPVTLVCLPEQGVEWLPNTVDGVGIGREDKCSKVGQLLQRALSLSSFREKISIVNLLHHSLEEGERLIEVHLVRNKGENEISVINS